MNNSLIDIARQIRINVLRSIAEAGSGHTGGSLGLADIFTVLYFHQMNHKPDNPKWAERDRLILSIGHVAPVHYACLAQAGYFPIEELLSLRKLGSRLQGHPDKNYKLPGLELSAGSLGQGLSVAVGMAIAAKHNKSSHNIYAITGDGELQEGSIWEAIMSAAHYHLDNLTVIVDRNRLQIDGKTEDVLSLEPLKQKWEAFGWNVLECDGNNIEELKEIFEIAKNHKNQPTIIIANTLMGKGVAEIENNHQWHGKAPTKKELLSFIANNFDKTDDLLKNANFQLNTEYIKKAPKIEEPISINNLENFKESDFPKTYISREKIATKTGFGEGVKAAAKQNTKVIGIGSDITASVGMNIFANKFPQRFYSLGIAEQNAVGVAAGLSLEGHIPIFSTYAVFSTMRALDQIRISLCYNNLHSIIGGAHSGISVGADGATHQALEDIAALRALPNITIISPCDATQAKLATIEAINNYSGPIYIRYGRTEVSDFTLPQQNFIIGKAQYFKEGKDIAIIATGPLLWQAIKAAETLKEKNISARVINMHTIKPLDKQAIIKAATDCGCILSVEEHQITGGLGSAISEIIVKHYPVPMDFVGMPNCFGESGEADELLDKYGMNENEIIKKAIALIKKKSKL